MNLQKDQTREGEEQAAEGQWFVLDDLLGMHLLKELPAYKNSSFKYSDLNSFLPELKGKTQGQLDRLQRNLKALQLFPFVSEIFLDRKFSVSKLCGATDKFHKSCQKIELQLKTEHQENVKKLAKQKQRKKDFSLKSLLQSEQEENDTSADDDQSDKNKLEADDMWKPLERNSQKSDETLQSQQDFAQFSDKANSQETTHINQYDPTLVLNSFKCRKKYLYDPLLEKETKAAQLKNRASKGSILRVWQGNIIYQPPDQVFKACFYSNKDIRLYQCLQQWPSQLMVIGRAKSSDSISYFNANRKSRYLINGWIGVKTQNGADLMQLQELNRQLTDEQKFGVIKPTADNSVSVYLFPINQNKDFAESFINLPDIESYEDLIGFIGLVKKPLSLKRGFLNPVQTDDIQTLKKRNKKAFQKQRQSTGDGRSLSPITSEDDDVQQNFSVPKPQQSEYQQKEIPKADSSQVKITQQMRIPEESLRPLQPIVNSQIFFNQPLIPIDPLKDDADIQQLQGILNQSSTLTSAEILKLTQDTLQESNMMQRITQFVEVKRERLQAILKNLISIANGQQAPQSDYNSQRSQQSVVAGTNFYPGSQQYRGTNFVVSSVDPRQRQTIIPAFMQQTTSYPTQSRFGILPPPQGFPQPEAQTNVQNRLQ